VTIGAHHFTPRDSSSRPVSPVLPSHPPAMPPRGSLVIDPAGGGGVHGPEKLNREAPFKELYKVGTVIGEGAFGTVRLVTHRGDDTKWAVKVIEKSKIDPGDHALRTEIDILCRVNHVNCVGLKEWFDEPKRVLLVLEYVTGGTLFDQIVDSGRMDEERGRRAFVELASGLAYLHTLNIAHRDLKPENFMLSSKKEDAVAKLCDYGLSKILDQSAEGEKTVCGTPSYVAPEILKTLTKGGTYDAIKADAWSLGCNLYVLLGGYPPFWRYDDNQKRLFDHIVMNDWEFDQPCWKSISNGAKALIRSLMEPDLTKRVSVEQSLKDAWCASPASTAELPETLASIKALLAANKFRKTGLVILAQGRLARGIEPAGKHDL
jgi:serine/threonine protein kinase